MDLLPSCYLENRLGISPLKMDFYLENLLTTLNICLEGRYLEN
jgi:hypothetical protein